MRVHKSREKGVAMQAQVSKKTYSKGDTWAEEGELTPELMKLTYDHLLFDSF